LGCFSVLRKNKMDLNKSYQLNGKSSLASNGNASFGYDLNSDKQEIEKITQEVKKDLLMRWKKSYAGAQIFPSAVAAIHSDVVDFLLNFSLVSVYDNIAKQAGLDANGRNALPKIVWQIAQNKSWNLLDQILEEQIQLTHSVHVQVADLLRQNVLSKIQTLQEKPVALKNPNVEAVTKKEVQLPLSTALASYLKLAEQNVTTSQLKLRYMPELVRPSIKNWIKDFHDALGAVKHSPIDRGNFLFHSENGKKLSSTDRQKVAMLLKSLDEQTLLTIDTEKEEVVFGVENPVIKTNQVIGNQQSVIRTSPVISQQQEVIKTTPVVSDQSMGSVIQNNPVASRPFVISNERVDNHSVNNGNFFRDDSLSHEKIAKTENFFSVPNSKPPIGTESFDVQKELPKKSFSPNFSSAKSDTLSFSSPQKFSTEKVEVAKPPISCVQDFGPQPQSVTAKIIEPSVNPAKPLISPVPEKKIESVPQNFNVTENPFKQEVVIEQKPVAPIKQEIPVPKRPLPISPYHIGPSRRTYSQSDNVPKVSGNTVDLS
jgi:hypothetical protein